MHTIGILLLTLCFTYQARIIWLQRHDTRADMAALIAAYEARARIKVMRDAQKACRAVNGARSSDVWQSGFDYRDALGRMITDEYRALL